MQTPFYGHTKRSDDVLDANVGTVVVKRLNQNSSGRGKHDYSSVGVPKEPG